MATDLWPASLASILVASVATTWLLRHRPLTRGAVAAIVLAVLDPLVVLVAGSLFCPESGKAQGVREVVAFALVALPLVAGIACIVAAPTQRVATAALACAASWPYCVTYFLVGMTLANDAL